MSKNGYDFNTSSTLRKRAERFLGEKRWDDHFDSSVPQTEQERLIHELQVQQVHLELQNEELRRTQQDLELIHEKYVDLYDFAPVGFFTLDSQSVILDANLTGTAFLGLDKNQIINQPLTRFILPEDEGVFSRCYQNLFESSFQCLRTCKIRMQNSDGVPFYALLECALTKDASGNYTQVRAAMLDISELDAYRNHLEDLVQNR
ncbi:MAG TPA: PAS domain-containing protein, partial [Candidatus Lokiarchaeia archaeon]|nr:PAS domain-containing protein [Candidatus Lokiarchaeia archaeon]